MTYRTYATYGKRRARTKRATPSAERPKRIPSIRAKGTLY